MAVKSIEYVMEMLDYYQEEVKEHELKISLKEDEIKRVKTAIDNFNFETIDLEDLYHKLSRLYRELNSIKYDLEYSMSGAEHYLKLLEDAIPQSEIDKMEEIKRIRIMELTDKSLINLYLDKSLYSRSEIVDTNVFKLKNKNNMYVVSVKYDEDEDTYIYKEILKGSFKSRTLKVKRIKTVEKYIKAYIENNF